MAAYDLFYLSGTKQKRLPSASSTVDFLAIRIGASNLTISEATGHFDFGAKKLTNIADGTANGHAVSKGQMDTADNLRVLKSGDTMSGNLAMGGNKVTGLAAATVSGDAVEYAQFVAGLAATGTSAEWQNSVVTALTSPVGLTPSAGDRYLINGAGGSGWTGHDNEIATYVSGTVTLEASWTYQTPTTGTFTDADDQPGLLYYFGGSSWSTKSFEATTASGFLDKTGFNITLKNLANGKIILGDGSGVAQAVTPAGDVTISNTGTTTIANDAVTTAKILDANVTAAKLASDSVTTVKILDANVTAAKLAADSVTTVKILDANVTAAKLAADSVTTAKILDANVTAGKLASDSVTTAKILDANVTTAKIADAAVTADKIAAAVAGAGLAGGAGTALSVNTGDGTKIVSDAVVRDDAESLVNDNAGTVTVRQVVYQKSNGHVDLAQANGAFDEGTNFGLVEDATILTTATGKVTVRAGAKVAGFSSLTIGAPIFLSRSSAGGYQQDLSGFVAGEHVVSLGKVLSATTILFNPKYLFEY